VIGDKNATAGEKLASELTRSKFVQCDATVWEDQVRLYKEAAQLSSSGKIHYVIANAGTTKEDQTFTFDGKNSLPTLPHPALSYPLAQVKTKNRRSQICR
jgi:NAD(P)-dependent dehydrogenase (short-subunit alcohol dehydrogenase family)